MYESLNIGREKHFVNWKTTRFIILTLIIVLS